MTHRRKQNALSFQQRSKPSPQTREYRKTTEHATLMLHKLPFKQRKTAGHATFLSVKNCFTAKELLGRMSHLNLSELAKSCLKSWAARPHSSIRQQ
jgi:hypothetical protein